MKSNSRTKILYGAGEMGRRSLAYYGSDNVFAFSDRNKHGQIYLDKPVLDPATLITYQDDYDIVVCVVDYGSVFSELTNTGIRKSYVSDVIDDVRIQVAQNANADQSKITDELSKIDFIATPDAIDGYIDYFRNKLMAEVNANAKAVVNRNIFENQLYGYFDSMKKYADSDIEFYEAPSLSHGVWLNPTDFIATANSFMEPGLITRDAYHKKSKDYMFFTCGSFLHYVEQYYYAEIFRERKKRLGRNLLVFPLHSIPYADAYFSYKDFVEYSLNEAKRFDSITVCVYWNDYDSVLTQLFRATGASIVSAGFSFDTEFASRLKSIITMSDAVLTNSVGSHIPFCFAEAKPVKMYTQDVSLESEYQADFVTQSFRSNRKLWSVLAVDDYRITQEQLDAYELSAGFTQFKTKEEVRAIFDLSKRIIRDCDYKRTQYATSVRRAYRDLSHSSSPDDKLQFRLMREALPDDYEDYLSKLGV